MKTFILKLNAYEMSRTVMGVIEAESLEQAGGMLGLREKKASDCTDAHFLHCFLTREQGGMVCEFIDRDRAMKMLDEAFPLNPVPAAFAMEFPLCLREVSKFVPPPRPSDNFRIDQFDSEATGC